MRQLVDFDPEQPKFLHEKFKAFANDVNEIVKRFFYDPFVHQDSGAEDRLPVVMSDAAFTSSDATHSSGYHLTNAMRSSEANNIVLCERLAVESALLARGESCLINDISDTSDDQVRWSEPDRLDTASIYPQSPFPPSETPPRSGVSAFPEENTVDPAVLCQRASPDLCAISNVLQEHVSKESCHNSRNIVADVRRSKKRASNVEIQPSAKRSKRSIASSSSAAGAIESSIIQYETTTPTQPSGILATDQFILPKGNPSVQISHIKGLFEDRLGHQERQHASLLTNLFFAIASPLSFFQLLDATRAIKSRESFQVSESSLTISDVVRRLDALESTIVASSLMRRFYLLQLFRKRACLREEIQAKRNRLRSGRRTGGEPGKVASLVLTEMTREAYHSSAVLPGYRRDLKAERKSLQNRLYAATHWNTLREEFSVGIIALVPVGGDSHIQDQRSVLQECCLR
jgi:hypothetical protein